MGTSERPFLCSTLKTLQSEVRSLGCQSESRLSRMTTTWYRSGKARACHRLQTRTKMLFVLMDLRMLWRYCSLYRRPIPRLKGAPGSNGSWKTGSRTPGTCVANSKICRQISFGSRGGPSRMCEDMGVVSGYQPQSQHIQAKMTAYN